MESMAYKDTGGGGWVIWRSPDGKRASGALERSVRSRSAHAYRENQCRYYRPPALLPVLVLIGHWQATAAMVESNDSQKQCFCGHLPECAQLHLTASHFPSRRRRLVPSPYGWMRPRCSKGWASPCCWFSSSLLLAASSMSSSEPCILPVSPTVSSSSWCF